MKMSKLHLIVIGLMTASICLGNSNAERWKNMSEEERAEIRKRMENLTPGQLEKLRERKKQFDRKPNEEREKGREGPREAVSRVAAQVGPGTTRNLFRLLPGVAHCPYLVHPRGKDSTPALNEGNACEKFRNLS